MVQVGLNKLHELSRLQPSYTDELVSKLVVWALFVLFS